MTASLAAPTKNTGDAKGDKYVSIENLTGSRFADMLIGDGKDNILTGGAGEDRLDGGAGKDTASYFNALAGVTASLLAPSGNRGDAKGDSYIAIENLIGSDFADRLTGNNGVNILDGGDGDDWLDGGAGNDRFVGGNGKDTVAYGTATAAVLVNLAATSKNTGAAKGDTYSSIENAAGSRFNDTLIGTSRGNILIGGLGADKLDGGAGSDTASYENAAKAVVANLTSPSKNTGDAKSDSYHSIENLTGSAFADTLTGNAGDNILTGGAGADKLSGGSGDDTASYATATKAVTVNLGSLTKNSGDAKGDTYHSIEVIKGSAFDDTLTGNSAGNDMRGGDGDDTISGGGGGDTLHGEKGYDTLKGGDGNDTLIGGGGPDRLEGGAGSDTASYETADKSVTVRMGSPYLNEGDAYFDRYISIENIKGSAFGDTLEGDGTKNMLTGGDGADHFLFGSYASQTDTLTDMSFLNVNDGQDKDYILLNHYVFGEAGDSRTLSEDALQIGSINSAEGKDTRIIYNYTNGWLIYDSDGSEDEGTIIHFATVTTYLDEAELWKFTPDHTQFLIV